MGNPFEDWKNQAEEKVADIVVNVTGEVISKTQEALNGVTSATKSFESGMGNVVADFQRALAAVGLPDPNAVSDDARRRIKTAFDHLGLPQEPPDPQEVVNQFKNWVVDMVNDFPNPKEELDKLLRRLNALILWIKIDDELIENPNEMYTKLIRKLERTPRPTIGDKFEVYLGGLGAAPLATAIRAGEAIGGSRRDIASALREALFNLPGLPDNFKNLRYWDFLKPNPTDIVIIVAIICIACVILGLGVPIVTGGSAVFFGIAAALVIATAMGNEIDVSASNPLKFSGTEVGGLPVVTGVELGPVVTLSIRKAR
ncbi:MAG: hypothetical protein Q6358_09355 [Candidatus Brocadiales bacterium]|nr:hypothetical protein [Candidatus Brocadiales bacterium]